MQLRLLASALLLLALTGCMGEGAESQPPKYPREHGSNITDARTCEILGFRSIDGLAAKFGYETAWETYIRHCAKGIKPAEEASGPTVELAATAWEFSSADAAAAAYAYNLAQRNSFIRSMKNSSMFQISGDWDEGMIAAGMERADERNIKMAARTGQILVHYSVSIFRKGDDEPRDGAPDTGTWRKWLAESVSRAAPAQLRAAFPEGASPKSSGH